MSSNIDRIAKQALKNKKKTKFEQIENERFYGKAPVWTGVKNTDEDFKSKYTNALNWANAVLDPAELKEELLKFLETERVDSSNISQMHEIRLAHIGKFCWLINNGCPLTNESMSYVNAKIAELKSVGPLQAEVIEFPVSNKEASLARVYGKVLSDIDHILEPALMGEQESDGSSVYDLLASREDSKLAKHLLEVFENRRQGLIAEVLDIENLSDEEVITQFDDEPTKEKYLADLTNQIELFEQTLVQINSFLGNKKALKKSFKRKAQVRTAEKQIKNLKFKVQDREYQLTSIPPASVVGMQTLVTFNTKNRKLSVYVAKDETGLSVKGTTVHNFDEEKSTVRTVKNPKMVLNQIQGGIIRRLYVLLKDEVRTKPAPANGRINPHTILVRAFKEAMPNK